jgi:hypothetical protein
LYASGRSNIVLPWWIFGAGPFTGQLGHGDTSALVHEDTWGELKDARWQLKGVTLFYAGKFQ